MNTGTVFRLMIPLTGSIRGIVGLCGVFRRRSAFAHAGVAASYKGGASEEQSTENRERSHEIHLVSFFLEESVSSTSAIPCRVVVTRFFQFHSIWVESSMESFASGPGSPG